MEMKQDESYNDSHWDHFDRVAGERLRHYEESPSEEMLARIERSLAAMPAPKASRPLRSNLRIWSAVGGIAAAVALIVTLTLPLFRPQTDSTLAPAIARLDLPTGPTTARTPEEPAPALRAEHTEPLRHATETPTATLTTATAAETTAATEPLLADPRQPQEVAAQTASAQTVAEETGRTQENTAPARPTVTPDSKADQAARSLRERTDAYWDRLLAQESGRNNRTARKRAVSYSLYAGNFGAGQANIDSSDPSLMNSDLIFLQQDDDGIAEATNLVDEEGNPIGGSIGHMPEEMSLRHRMPLNVGVSLAVPITDRLAFVTGVNYSYLYSSSQQQFAASQVSATRELHYLGLPVGLSYTFFRTGDFHFYVQGYGMVEKAVACRESFRLSTDQDRGYERYSVEVKGVQWSLGVSAGVQYACNEHIGLYVEPGASYYFPTSTQPENYRTVHPVSFALKLGVRFGV